MSKTKKKVSKKSAKGAKKNAQASKNSSQEKRPNPGQPRGNGAKRPSALDAAAQILAEAGEPLSCPVIMDCMLAKGLWQTKGKTPAGTIYAAITREIAAKGDKARFKKTERGKFTLNK